MNSEYKRQSKHRYAFCLSSQLDALMIKPEVKERELVDNIEAQVWALYFDDPGEIRNKKKSEWKRNSERTYNWRERLRGTFFPPTILSPSSLRLFFFSIK